MEYCTQHAPEGTVDVKNRKGRTEGCGKQPSFGVAGTKEVEHGAPFAPKGMADACSRNGSTGSDGNKLSFGLVNTRTVEDHAQNTRLKCGVEGYRGQERFAHTTAGRKPLVTQFGVVVNIPTSIVFLPRQALRRVVAGALVSEHGTQKLRLRPRSESSHKSRLEEL